MRDHAHAGNPPVGLHAYEQVNRTAVSVGCNGLQDHRAWLAVLHRDIGRHGLPRAEQRILHQNAAVEQLIVIAVFWEDLVEGA